MITLSEAQMKSKTAYRVFRKEQLERMTELLAQKAIDARLVDESENNYQAAVGAEDAAREAIATARLKADAAAANIQSAEADLDEAKAQVMVSEAELGQAQVMLDYTTIVSDYDGVVTRRSFNRGRLRPLSRRRRGPDSPSLRRAHRQVSASSSRCPTPTCLSWRSEPRPW